jgi:hypothetical protein
MSNELNDQSNLNTEGNKNKPIIIALLIIIVIGIIAIIILQITGYSIFDSFKKQNGDVLSLKTLNFKECKNGDESECTQRIKLDNKEIKISAVKMLVSNDTEEWEIRINDKKVIDKYRLEDDPDRFDDFKMEYTKTLLLADDCNMAGCSKYYIIDPNANVKELQYLDKDNPGMSATGSEVDINVDVLYNNIFVVHASRFTGQTLSFDMGNEQGDEIGCADSFIEKGNHIDEAKLAQYGVNNNTILNADYKVTYMGNSEYDIKMIKVNEYYSNDVRQRIDDYCQGI